MLEQTAYVGPLRFDVRYGDGCEAFCFSKEFERKTKCSHKKYQVQMHCVPHITLGKRGIKVSKGIEEISYGNETVRYFYKEIDGERRYYAKAVWNGSMISAFVDVKRERYLGQELDVWQFLFLELLLSFEQAVILHSASVIWDNKAILFSAPSGTGKSTQADLWKKYMGATGLNGDRNILYKNKNTWYACGLPWHGASQDCISAERPVHAIAIIRQAKENDITILNPVQKFQLINSELSVNSWNREFMLRICDLVEQLSMEVPIMQLNCNISRNAVECLHQYLKKGVDDGTIQC